MNPSTTVFRTFEPIEAQLVRSRLDAAGFHAEVMHELSSLSMEGYSMSTGGVKVQVPNSEAAAARELIDSKEDGAQ